MISADRRDALHRASVLPQVEQDADPGKGDEGAADESQHGKAAWHQAGPVHQVGQDQPVADADDEAGAEQERQVLDRRGDSAYPPSEAASAAASSRNVTMARTARMPTRMKTHSMIRAAT